MKIFEKIMSKPFNKQLKKFVKAYRLTNSELASKLDITYQALHNVLSGNNYPKVATLILLSENYPDLNMNWLLTGEGEMKIGQPAKTQEIESLENQLTMCKKENKLLNEMVDNQRLVIDLMKKSNAS